MSNSNDEISYPTPDLRNCIPGFSIDDAKRAALCFRDTLVISSNSNSGTDALPVGGYCILVERIGVHGREFLVLVQSSMTVDGCFGGSSVISSVTEKLHCLEEKRTEFIHRDDGLREKIIFIGAEEDLYHVNITNTCPRNKHTEKKDLPFCCNDKLLSEGGNILLMRYLAIANYEGTFSLESCTIDGDVAISDYTCTMSEDINLNDQHLAVYTVERKIYTEGGPIQNIKTLLTPEGRILRHDWKDTPYFLQINPLVDLSVPIKSAHIKTPLKDRWTEDIEMLSKYLDMKTQKMSECTEYLNDHPEIKQLIADFAQTLLIVKPVNLLEFTIQHFKAFATDPKVWEDDFLDEQFDTDVTAKLQKNGLNESFHDSFSSNSSKCSMNVACNEGVIIDQSQNKESPRKNYDLTEEKNFEEHHAAEHSYKIHKVCPECPACLQVYNLSDIFSNCYTQEKKTSSEKGAQCGKKE